MRRRSKSTETVKITNPQTSEDQNNFVQIPLDVVIEIIGRLPWKSVARFLVVSKSWEAFICSRYFITSFPFGSSLSSQTRLLTTFNDCIGKRKYLDFFSSSSSSTLGCDEEQIIFNPTTGKSITLPRVVTWRKIIKTYFGYDPVNDQYKVLCLTKINDNHGSIHLVYHQVLTFGAREPWRVMDDCSIPHYPWSSGLCIDGVLYYVAITGKEVLLFSMMRFDLRSEKLDLLTGLPASLEAPDACTVYFDKVQGESCHTDTSFSMHI
ncbi:unnamed protein product [Microthlaspi erraticum]|uniref:F-box domain-containing protein n=1 Tax=Microthlaspi erraticum TaxID=1685480 RepID=A0A6D2KHD8_9BRAS|nr:unnamed protein product [Microthlaspi erraticum]